MRFRNLPGRKYALGLDTFIRHRLLASLASKFNPKTILDVGGEGVLKLYLPKVQIVTANLKAADICYSGDRLPVMDNSFDVVVSLDTMEHLPKHKRTPFLSELHRVGRKGFILCAPLGTSEHLAYEKEILSLGVLDDDSFTYLTEHVQFGLPIPEEVHEMAKMFSGKLFYQGDFRKVRPVTNRSVYMGYYGLLVQTISNMLIDVFWQEFKYLMANFTPYTNRFFLIANKIDNEC